MELTFDQKGRRRLILTERSLSAVKGTDLRQSKRAFRHYRRDRFLYLMVKAWCAKRSDIVAALDTIILLGRRYVFLFSKDSRAIFFAEDGPGFAYVPISRVRKAIVPLGLCGVEKHRQKFGSLGDARSHVFSESDSSEKLRCSPHEPANSVYAPEAIVDASV